MTTDLRDFQLINPCGITDKPVTSLEREIPEGVSLPGLEEMAHQAARQFGQVFGQQVLAVESMEALRAQAAQRNRRCRRRIRRCRSRQRWSGCMAIRSGRCGREQSSGWLTRASRMRPAIYNPAGTGRVLLIPRGGVNDSCQPT